MGDISRLWQWSYLTLLFTAWGLSPWVELEATLSSEAVKGGFSYRVFACLGWWKVALILRTIKIGR